MSGEKTALEIANQARPLEIEDDGEQIDMLASLGLPINDNVLNIRAQREARTGKPGRPLNARNKRTVEMADYLLRRYRSPLETLMQIQATPVDELAAALGCTKHEALQEIRLAAIACKDHVHSKMPVAVDVTNRKVINLTINVDDGQPTGGDPAAGGIGLVDEIIDLTAKDITPESVPAT